MENKITRRLFEEMIERKQKIKEAENFILHEELKFKEIVKDAQEEVKINQDEILKIRNKQIKLGADTLVEEIAKEWGVDVKDLFIDVKFVDTERFGVIGRNKFIRLCENESFNGLIKCYLNVKCDKGNINRLISLKLPLNLLHYQRNGERLKQYLDVKSTFKGWSTYTDFECADYKNLIFEFQYDSLIDTRADEFKARDKKCEMILNAYERECANKAEVKPLHIV